MFNSLLKTIEKIREKKDSHKKAVAFLTSSTIALAIFFVWLSTNFIFSLGISSESQRAETSSPIVSLKKSFATVSESVRGEFQEIRERFSSEIEEYMMEESRESPHFEWLSGMSEEEIMENFQNQTDTEEEVQVEENEI